MVSVCSTSLAVLTLYLPFIWGQGKEGSGYEARYLTRSSKGYSNLIGDATVMACMLAQGGCGFPDALRTVLLLRTLSCAGYSAVCWCRPGIRMTLLQSLLSGTCIVTLHLTV